MALSRYIVDFVSKIFILIFSFVITFNAYEHWNWFKGVQNQSCHQDDAQLIQNIIVPYENIYSQMFLNFFAIFVITIVMLIIDGFHF